MWVAALFGDTDPYRNLAPTWVYVVFWLGVPVLSVVFGNVWRALSPWRALADAFVWLRERGGREAKPLADYPERLGRWPAALALLAFASLELAYADPVEPARARVRDRALHATSRSSAWPPSAATRGNGTARGSPLLFGFFARIGPFFAGRRPDPRPLAADRPRRAPSRMPGTLAFVAVMLGSVLFDGYSRTTTWQDLAARVEAPFIVDRARPSASSS